MSKYPLLLALAFIVTLPSCLQPHDVPPPRFRPNPPYPPAPIPPDDGEYDGITEPPDIGNNPPPPTPADPYPTAKATSNPGEVISPYPPYNVIDISGPPLFRSGQLARDPSNQKIFRVP